MRVLNREQGMKTTPSVCPRVVNQLGTAHIDVQSLPNRSGLAECDRPLTLSNGSYHFLTVPNINKKRMFNKGAHCRVSPSDASGHLWTPPDTKKKESIVFRHSSRSPTYRLTDSRPTVNLTNSDQFGPKTIFCRRTAPLRTQIFRRNRKAISISSSPGGRLKLAKMQFTSIVVATLIHEMAKPCIVSDFGFRASNF
jgi:hypothetical protein